LTFEEPIAIELLVRKNRIKGQKEESKEETKSEEKGWENENYLEKYEALTVRLSPTCFKHCKSVLILFQVQTEMKAKFRLMGMHTRLIGNFILENQRRLENLHKKVNQSATEDQELSSEIGEFLGTQQVTLNMVEQISHYLKYISNVDQSGPQTYMLSQEIDYCLDGLTACQWDNEIEVILSKG
jgi:hypothetical protein